MTIQKRYPDPRAAERALANRQCLDSLGALVPAAWIEPAEPAVVRMRQVPGHHPTTDRELARVASALGTLHSAALSSRKTAALPDFVAVREHTPALSGVSAEWWQGPARGAPTVIYKDTNRRNVLICESDVWWIDFDQLTKAPPGYDLAKLIVSGAMTFGQIPPVGQLLDAYCTTLGDEDAVQCARRHLETWLDLNALLTAPYVRPGHYRYYWPGRGDRL